MGRSKVAFRLDRALRDRRLVRLGRGIERADKLEGYVVLRADAWVLMAVVDDGIRLNGFAALRSADVVAVKPRTREGFVGKAIRHSADGGRGLVQPAQLRRISGSPSRPTTS